MGAAFFKSVAEQLIKAKADYVLALKDNHPTLRADVTLWLDSEIEQGRLAVQETIEKGHGRVEVRRYALSTQIRPLSKLAYCKFAVANGGNQIEP